MSLRPVISDLLPKLHPLNARDKWFSNQPNNQKRCEKTGNRSKRDISKNIKKSKFVSEPNQQLVNHRCKRLARSPQKKQEKHHKYMKLLDIFKIREASRLKGFRGTRRTNDVPNRDPKTPRRVQAANHVNLSGRRCLPTSNGSRCS